METYDLFDLPSDHWTWIAVHELPWPHSGFGFMPCCGRCGNLSPEPSATYALAWDKAFDHHKEERGGLLSEVSPGRHRRSADASDPDSIK